MSSTSCSTRRCSSGSPPRCKWLRGARLGGPHSGFRTPVVSSGAPSREAQAGVACAFHGARLRRRVKKRNTFLLSMRFMEPEMETRYSVEKEKQSGAAFSCSCVVLLCAALAEMLIDPW